MWKTEEEIKRELEADMRRTFFPKNKYGYEVNIRNPVLRSWYESYKRSLGIPYQFAPTDAERLEWERKVKQFIKREYKKIFKCELRDPFNSFTEKRVEYLVQTLGEKNQKNKPAE